MVDVKQEILNRLGPQETNFSAEDGHRHGISLFIPIAEDEAAVIHHIENLCQSILTQVYTNGWIFAHTDIDPPEMQNGQVCRRVYFYVK
jgi:hypothetical protein